MRIEFPNHAHGEATMLSRDRVQAMVASMIAREDLCRAHDRSARGAVAGEVMLEGSPHCFLEIIGARKHLWWFWPWQIAGIP